MACVHRAKERQGEEGRKRAVCASRGLAWRPGKRGKERKGARKGGGPRGRAESGRKKGRGERGVGGRKKGRTIGEHSVHWCF